jgi:hypothetical protein
MIYINPEDQKIKDASEKHYIFIRYVIKKKLDGNSFVENKPDTRIQRINRVSNIPINIKNFLNDEANLKDVIIGKPNIINNIKNTFTTNNEMNCLRLLFNYENWVKEENFYEFYNAYSLANSLDINTCTYCNRLYTKTVINPDKITRPEFDHWFPKSKFPLLALSFYNLIPSCHVCNSAVKGAIDLNLADHFHPYIDNEKVINDDIKFSYYNKTLDTYGFQMKTSSNKGKNTIDAFKIKEIYETHEEEIADLRKIRDTYSESYLQKLSSLYKGIMSPEEVYRLAFGVYIEEAKFDKRPLSKMKRDILIELGIIKKDDK